MKEDTPAHKGQPDEKRGLGSTQSLSVSGAVQGLARGRVPQRDDPHLGMTGMTAENAERGRVKQEMHPFAGRRADPSHGQDTAELAMREKRDVSRQRGEARDEPVGAGGNLIWRFAPWATIAKNTPAGVFLANVRGVPSFVIAVIPLRQAGSTSAVAPRPASSQVRRARCRRLVRT